MLLLLYRKPEKPQAPLKTFMDLYRNFDFRAIKTFANPLVCTITTILLNHCLKALAIQTKELADFLNCLKEMIIFVSSNQSLRQIICVVNELN